MPRSYWTRRVVWTGLTLLIVGVLAPFVISVNFWHLRIAAALSRGLGRPVRIGATHLKLFGGLGFEIDNVVLEEDPRFGIEPFVRMETLRATLGVRSLFERRMEFSSVVFVHPSLNVVRNAEGQLNLESLWNSRQAAPSSSGKGAAGDVFLSLPRIQIEGGRINFKSEARKRAYLVDNLDMEVDPPLWPGDPWQLRFEGRPNRTDFPLNPVSEFRGTATFGPFSPGVQAKTGTLVNLDLSAENALVGDLLRIFTGNDYGVWGACNLRLHLAGTTSLLRLSGAADLSDLHRSDLLPSTAPSSLHADVAAVVDMERDSLDLQSVSIPMEGGSVVIEGRIAQLFHHPQPSLAAQLHGLPLGGLFQIAKQFTTRVDQRLTARGVLDGHLQFDGTLESLAGSLSVTKGGIEQTGTPLALRLSDFKIVFDGMAGRAGPLVITLGAGGKLGSSANWDFTKRRWTARLQGNAIPLAAVLPWARAIGSRWGQADFGRGDLALDLSIGLGIALSNSAGNGERTSAEMSGWAEISGAQLNSSAVNEPILIPAARLQFEPGKVTVKEFSAALGPLELHGTFAAVLSPPLAPGFPPIEFDVQASAVDISDLDRLLNPRYRPAPFFRFSGGGDRGSSFFAGLRAQGSFEAEQLSYGRQAIRNFKAAMDFRERTLEIKSFSGEFAGGAQNGTATLQFTPDGPSFSLQSRFSNLDLNQLTKGSSGWDGFFSGKLKGNLRLAGAGEGWQEILDHLGGSGDVAGTNLELSGIDLERDPDTESNPATHIASLSSTFQIAKREVHITGLRMVPVARPSPGERKPSLWIVTGAVGFDRTLDLTVEERSGRHPSHWRGTLADPRVGETAVVVRATSHPR